MRSLSAQLAESITRITNELTVIVGDTFLRPSLQRVVTELCQRVDPPSPREIETAVELLAQAAAAAGDMMRANYLRSRLIEGLDFGVRASK